MFHHLERAIGSLLELQHLYFDIYKHLGTATAPVKSTINNLTTLKVMIVIPDALLRAIMWTGLLAFTITLYLCVGYSIILL